MTNALWEGIAQVQGYPSVSAFFQQHTGKSMRYMAKALGCDHKTIGRLLDIHGLPRPLPKRRGGYAALEQD